MTNRPRIGVACSSPVERAAVADWLQSGGFEPVVMFDELAIGRELDRHPFELLIVDDALLASGSVTRMMRARGIRRPMIVVADADAPASRQNVHRDATTMTRPLAQNDLVLSVSLALAEGRPARRSPRVSVPYISSTIDGVPSQLVDVSNEGLRVELSDQHRGAVPPFFTVRIPSFNIAVVAKRVWVAPAMPQAPGRLWCGAVLAGRTPGEAWRTLLEQAPTAGGFRSQVVKLR